MQEHFRARLHRKTKTQSRVAVQLTVRARSALSKSTGIWNLQSVYWSYSIYGSRTALVPAIMSYREGFSARSLHQLLNGVEGPKTTEKDLSKAAWEHCDAVSHVMGLMTLYFFS